MNYTVVDDFLPRENYIIMKTMFESGEFDWHWSDHQVNHTDSFYFYHLFFAKYYPTSKYFDNVRQNFLDFLPINSLINLRANLYTNTYGNGTSSKHADHFGETGKDHKHTTSVLHLGTNNGKFVLCIGDEEVVLDTVDNRLVTFDSEIEHYIIHQTDADRRIVLNLNYY
jgi:hypothetical protein